MSRNVSSKKIRGTPLTAAAELAKATPDELRALAHDAPESVALLIARLAEAGLCQLPRGFLP